MQDNIVPGGKAAMKFSIIIPLEFHRDRALDCVRGWVTTQDLPPGDFELVCVLPAHDPDGLRKPVVAMLRPHDHLILSNESHDMAQCAEGAAVAQGEFLFFTESHVWPEHDVLVAMLEHFGRHPELAACSGRTIPVATNRLARMEADFYEHDINQAMTQHPWRRILDQIFITRRQAYRDAGGFDPALGHFAEWALAARYHDLGLKIGYAPHITLRHYYCGDVAELSAFTRSFIEGEIAYFARGRATDSVIWNEIPPEWSQRGGLDRRHAGALAACLRKALFARPRPAAPADLLREYLMWAGIAAGLDRRAAAARLVASRLMLAVAVVAGSRATLERRYGAFARAIIHLERLKQIGAQVVPSLPGDRDSDLLAVDDRHAGRMAGFHMPESYQSAPMRWSAPAALVELSLPGGLNRIEIHCAPVREPLASVAPAFFVDEAPLAPDRVSFDGHRAVISLGTRQPGPVRLAWICKSFLAPGDTRRLGLPLSRIAVENQPA
jgi:hypothetical protein